MNFVLRDVKHSSQTNERKIIRSGTVDWTTWIADICIQQETTAAVRPTANAFMADEKKKHRMGVKEQKRRFSKWVQFCRRFRADGSSCGIYSYCATGSQKTHRINEEKTVVKLISIKTIFILLVFIFRYYCSELRQWDMNIEHGTWQTQSTCIPQSCSCVLVTVAWSDSW